ncbi:MAG: ferredoxin family protein [Phycisphaerae bacterium]|nr:ferredoxin family protein [Phycisphaerae bacterium]
MTPVGPILFCRCRHGSLVCAEDVRRVEAALSAAGVAVEAVDDLCALTAGGDGRLAAWSGRPDVTIVACFPRAVRALFAHAGAPLPDDAVVHNLRQAGPAAVLRDAGILPALDSEGGLTFSTDQLHGTHNAGETPASRDMPGPEWPAWFPVIDRQRCTRCRKCLSFCLFSVYEFAGDEVRVGRPANCKNNCPACARVCPARAIIFPKCKDAPINGDDPDLAPAGDFRADAAKLAPSDLKEVLRRRAEQNQNDTAKNTTNTDGGSP